MKLDYTREEAERSLRVAAEENDLARLVDPEARRVYPLSGEAGETECYSLWGRCERCENCSSLRALHSQGRAYKVESCGEKTFLVISRFLRVYGRPCVAETVNDVTDQMLLESDRTDSIGPIIASYNRLLITDPLTGVYNRRFLDESFLPSLECCHKPGLIVNLAVMDLDDFKRVNDVYGHLAGDALLKDVAGFWKLYFNSRRKNRERLTVRFGGDELLVITCGIPGARFQEELSRAYRQMRRVCYFQEDIQIPFSITFGTASSEELGQAWTWDALFNRADQRLYAAKAARGAAPTPESGK